MKLKECIRNHYLVAFFTSLILSAGLLITSFLLPPQGEIHPSVLQACAIILVYPGIAFAAKALDDNKKVKIQTAHATLTVGKVGDEGEDAMLENEENDEMV